MSSASDGNVRMARNRVIKRWTTSCAFPSILSGIFSCWHTFKCQYNDNRVPQTANWSRWTGLQTQPDNMRYTEGGGTCLTPNWGNYQLLKKDSSMELVQRAAYVLHVPHLPYSRLWRWRQYVPPKRRWTYGTVHRQLREPQISMTVTVQFMDFRLWYRSADAYQRFGRTCCLHLHGLNDPADESSMFLRNVSNGLPDCTVSPSGMAEW
jgi:hypothetical protein